MIYSKIIWLTIAPFDRFIRTVRSIYFFLLEEKKIKKRDEFWNWWASGPSPQWNVCLFCCIRAGPGECGRSTRFFLLLWANVQRSEKPATRFSYPFAKGTLGSILPRSFIRSGVTFFCPECWGYGVGRNSVVCSIWVKSSVIPRKDWCYFGGVILWNSIEDFFVTRFFSCIEVESACLVL